ncbi:contact-dependent growth inhibition system immunity protein [Herbaspirillum rubrisubalbicans]|uniref:contact-dependent growth inhibition system immunity protein n=1 Tax=Herbaspirillum rubrisubalbicans TaxID=80842 RepID=UPI00155A01C1|nr:contact-dependent growth inhibition system immunity protein [Herbaspirillum rubrisubalbicans]
MIELKIRSKAEIEAKAEVGFNGDFFQIIPYSISMVNYVEPSAAVCYLAADVGNDVLGRSVRLAFDESKVVSPEKFQEVFASGKIQEAARERVKAAMQKYGYKSKRELLKNMMCCWISMSETVVQIKPTHHKTIDGYAGISVNGDEILHLPSSATDEEIGNAVREGIRRCTSAIR